MIIIKVVDFCGKAQIALAQLPWESTNTNTNTNMNTNTNTNTNTSTNTNTNTNTNAGENCPWCILFRFCLCSCIGFCYISISKVGR